ncbi:MAG TPA: glycosyltransferase [Vicinamibacterales bacterium]|nr:glycosyltransferase [Vicinamibacterales bacterium]
MRILWLNAGLLLPLDKGGKLRTWHLMRHLARRHSITYVCFAEPNEKKEHREGMVEVCNSLVTVARSDPAKGSTAFYLDAVRHVVNALPYAVGKYQSDEYAGRVEYLLQHGRFDVMVADFLPPVVNLPKSIPVPAVLFTHNVEAEIWRRHAENASNPLSRILLKQQWHRMLRFEREALTRFDLVLGVSDTDRETFARLYPGALRRPVHVVQTGVDTAYFTPMPGQERPRHLVFTGSMDWLPNEDGMLYFVRDILPRIRATEPDVTLSIVGRTPTPAVQRLAAENGIEVTGRVDDVRPHVAAAEVYIVPLRIGGGTRLKIFEAMSMAKAVVSTTIGAEGLPVTPGRDIVLADEPAAFADAVVQLIRDREKRQSIERAARDLVVQKYDWAAVSRDFEEALSAARGESHVSRMSA